MLGIADDEERPRARPQLLPVLLVHVLAGEIEEDLGLQRIGVLKFIDQQVGEALLEVAAHYGVIAQHVARADEEVLKCQRSVLLAFGGKGFGGRTQHIESDAVHVLAPALDSGTNSSFGKGRVARVQPFRCSAVRPPLQRSLARDVIALIQKCELFEWIVEVPAATLLQEFDDHHLEIIGLVAVGVRRQMGLDLFDELAECVANPVQVRAISPPRDEDHVWIFDDLFESPP